MGHIRLGQLPRTRRWRDVIDLLAAGGSPEAVASAIAHAADDRLGKIGSDPGLGYLYWLLTRLAWHSRTDEFVAALRADGIELQGEADGLRLLSRVGQFAAREVRRQGQPNAISEIALRAFRETLSRVVEQRANTLFGTTGADVQSALREVSTPKGFSGISRQFFGTFFAGFLEFVASKETSNHVGLTSAFANSEEAAHFETELRAFAHQSARILEEYSGDWYSKHNWLGDVDKRQAGRFVAYAVKKLRDEMKMAGARS